MDTISVINCGKSKQYEIKLKWKIKYNPKMTCKQIELKLKDSSSNGYKNDATINNNELYRKHSNGS
jgi:hypothetical protein